MSDYSAANLYASFHQKQAELLQLGFPLAMIYKSPFKTTDRILIKGLQGL